MRKLVIFLALIVANVSFSQVYEVGFSYNPGRIFGEQKASDSFFGSNFGVAIKKNMNPRLAYRVTVANITSNNTKLTEFSAGIDFNFKNYNLVRSNGWDKSTAYVILELAGLSYDNGFDSKEFTMAIPMGVGYKKSLSRYFIASIEAKGRVAFTDKLDNAHDKLSLDYVKQNKTTLDAYYYIGASIYYTFGWPRGSENQTRF